MNNDLISRSALKEDLFIKFGNQLPNGLLEEVDNAPSPVVDCKKCDGYEVGYQAGVKDSERQKGEFEITNEDIQLAIKTGFDDGYAMAKAKFERPKGEWIELLRGIHITDYKCSCCGRTVRDDTGYDVSKDYPFCHCGADMRGEEE